ncbi:hypothetical protein CEXT_804891 [Caerostris extrusa]|uniref:Uncharacterized protein n=1 Tax=Caerostris extrusa TaxID=172846 RepID=A0AAV4MP78_CAEEX|nr:hypothetical protein CEXT_804891 [Caerostris extrusa]
MDTKVLDPRNEKPVHQEAEAVAQSKTARTTTRPKTLIVLGLDQGLRQEITKSPNIALLIRENIVAVFHLVIHLITIIKRHTKTNIPTNPIVPDLGPDPKNVITILPIPCMKSRTNLEEKEPKIITPGIRNGISLE